jgi:large subunit ribosomal protein L32
MCEARYAETKIELVRLTREAHYAETKTELVRLIREARYAETRIEQVRSTDMAVQQNKKSPSKRGMHRAHDFLTNPPLAVEPTTGEVHLRHHISPGGYYRGKKIVKSKGE